MKKVVFFIGVFLVSTFGHGADLCSNVLKNDLPGAKLNETAYAGVEIYPGYREAFSKLAQTFGKYFESKDENLKKQLHAEATGLINSIQSKMAEVLTQKGIEFELTPAFQEYTSYYALNWSFFKIKTTGSHWINKMAKSTKRKIDVDLAYDPISLSIMGFGGAFWQFKKTLTLSEDVITLPRAGYVEGHEMIHAHFWAYRTGSSKFSIGKAPVHIEMRSVKNIDSNPNPQATVYQNYMSYEEMVTFTFNILFAGKDFETKKDSQTKSKLFYEIAKLRQISKNALISADQGLALLNQKNFAPLSHEGIDFLLLGKQGEEFGMNIYLPKVKVESSETYTRGQLESAKKLAQFNLQKLENTESLSDVDLVKVSVSLRDLQKQFIKSLNN